MNIKQLRKIIKEELDNNKYKQMWDSCDPEKRDVYTRHVHPDSTGYATWEELVEQEGLEEAQRLARVVNNFSDKSPIRYR